MWFILVELWQVQIIVSQFFKNCHLVVKIPKRKKVSINWFLCTSTLLVPKISSVPFQHSFPLFPLLSPPGLLLLRVIFWGLLLHFTWGCFPPSEMFILSSAFRQLSGFFAVCQWQTSLALQDLTAAIWPVKCLVCVRVESWLVMKHTNDGFH